MQEHYSSYWIKSAFSLRNGEVTKPLGKENSLALATKPRRGWWRLGVATALFISSAIASLGDGAFAQIIGDTTLGNENSRVTSITPTVDQINGGATRGANLFHSFLEFNVGNGRSVFFTNPAGIENILTRVTGANVSNILGTLGVTGGNANLFLINPNGIIFGQNARLSLNGSFVATTANAIGLANGDIFSANPVEPLPNQLLNVNPNAFFFNQMAAQPIINRSIANSRGLQVPQGQSLLLVGGDVRLEGGRIGVPGGRVELGGLAGTGTVGLSVNDSDLRLSFPDGVARSDVSLSNNAQVDVSAGGGSIAINAQNLNVSGESRLQAGLSLGTGTISGAAGDIDIKVLESANITDDSVISNEVGEDGVNQGGNINIAAQSVSVASGRLSTQTSGSGRGGNINITAESVNFTDDGNFINLDASTYSSGQGGNINIAARSVNLDSIDVDIDSSGSGRGGNFEIKAESVSLKDSYLDASNVDLGEGGNIAISAKSINLSDGTFIYNYTAGLSRGGNVALRGESVSLTDATIYGVGFSGGSGGAGQVLVEGVNGGSVSLANSEILSFVYSGDNNNAGNITIRGGSVSLANGTNLSAGTRGSGNGGQILLEGTNGGTVSLVDSTISTAVEAKSAEGNGGDIVIKAGLVNLTNSTSLDTSTRGLGKGGNIDIRAESVHFTDYASVNTSTSGLGQGGNINITAESVNLNENAQVNARTLAQGDGGRVFVNAINGGSISLADNSFISTAVELGAAGNGGDIEINAGSVFVRGGASLETVTRGQGNAGDIQVNASELVEILGTSPFGFSSGLLTSSEIANSGKGGNITVEGLPNAPLNVLRVSDGAVLSARTQSQSPGGNIEVNVNTLEVTNGGQLITSTSGSGRAGDITINANERTIISGSNPNFQTMSDRPSNTNPNSNGIVSDIEPNDAIAQAQLISSDSFSLLENPDIEFPTELSHVSILGTGNDTYDYYSFQVKTPRSRGIFDIDYGGKYGDDPSDVDTHLSLFDQSGNLLASNDDGALTDLNSGGSAVIYHDSYLSYTFASPGTYIIQVGEDNVNWPFGFVPLQEGGTYTLQLSLDNNRSLNPNESANSGLFARSQGTGAAGNLTITTGQLLVQNSAEVTVSSRQGQAGNLTVTADSIHLENQGKLTAITGAGDNGGNITLRASDLLLMRNNSLISAEALGTANGGNITIDTDFIVAVPKENSDIVANADQGFGGRIDIRATGIYGLEFRDKLTPLSDINASSNATGKEGTVDITTPGIDPSRGLTNLPENLVDSSELIANSCIGRSSRQEENSFIITGTGGLPPRPGDAFTSPYPTGTVRSIPSSSASSDAAKTHNSTTSTPAPPVEAKGWMYGANGEIILTAQANTVTPSGDWSTLPKCD